MAQKCIILVLYLIVLGFGIALVVMTGTNRLGVLQDKACNIYYRSPVFTMGYLIIAMSLLGLGRTLCSLKVLRWLYILAILVSFTQIIVVVWFGIAEMSPGSKKAEKGMDLRMDDFSPWVQYHVTNGWSNIKACLIRSNVCTNTNSNPSHEKFHPALQAYFKKLIYSRASPLQRGCCLPPMACDSFEREGRLDHKLENAAAPAPAAAFLSALGDFRHDCEMWRNRRVKRCFDCDICKAGYMAETVLSWRRNFLMEIAFITCFVLIFAVSLRATVSRNGDHYHDEQESHHDTFDHNLLPGVVVETK